MKKFTILLFACIFLTRLSAQTTAENVAKADMGKVFEKMNSWFKNTPAYSLRVTHASYENYSTPVPVEKMTGYFKKENENYHSFLVGIHTVQNKRYKFVIDTSQKIILVANPDQLAWSGYTPDDYTSMLKNCVSIKVTDKGADKLYRLELPAHLSIAVYEFLVNAEGLPKEIIWYYNREIKKDENDEKSKVKPRASIGFSGYKTDVAFAFKEEFSETLYFTDDNKKLVPTGKYKYYKLSDQRLRN